MISSERSCKRIVAGTYDVLINEPLVASHKSVLTDFLEHFERYETELGHHHNHHRQQQQQQQQQQQLLQLQLQQQQLQQHQQQPQQLAHNVNTSDHQQLAQLQLQPLPPAPACGYIEEFRMLKELSKSLKENKANLFEGETEQNQRKNRYKDIIPFSHTRVILSCNPDAYAAAGHNTRSPLQLHRQLQLQLQHQQVHAAACQHPQAVADGTEPSCLSKSYINANYIRGPSGSPRAYIACQGPLPCTLNDFWRMIWECSVSVVVMACNEHESGKPKCELYWPDQIDGSQTYGNFRVSLLRVRQINSDFLIRKFSVQLLGRAASRRGLKVDQRARRKTPHSCEDRNNNHSNSNNTTNTSDNDIHCHRAAQAAGQSSGTAMANNKAFGFVNGNSSTSNESISTSDDSLCVSSGSNNHKGRPFVNLDGRRAMVAAEVAGTEREEGVGQEEGEADGTEVDDQDDEEDVETEADRPVLMERTICQFHYTTWPDHGVPDSVHPILELVRLIREVQPDEDKPVLVHCSAGCGRTGTICCIDYVWGLIRWGKLDSSFNLCNIISEMRQQRMAMVQTLEQYILCHRAVAALFMQQLQLISLDNNHNHHLEKCNSNKQNTSNNTSSSIDDSAIEDNERDDELDDDDDDDGHGDRDNADEDDYEQELGPVFI